MQQTKEQTMSQKFSILSRTESTVSAIAASAFAVVTVGIVLGAFASVAPTPVAHEVIVFDHVTISAPRSV